MGKADFEKTMAGMDDFGIPLDDERLLFAPRQPAPPAPPSASPPQEPATAKSAQTPTETPNAPFGAEKHRTRMRQRFDTHGIDYFEDYELLEMLLFRSLPRRDTRPVAKALLKRFGSIPAVLAAPTHLLKEVDHIGEAAAHDLRLVGALTRAANRANLAKEADLLGSWDKVLGYCRSAFAHEREERFHILFLNKRNRLIRDETLQRGTVDHTPVYPREIVKRALELSATALILVHNHPSGDPTPSPADIEMTKRIIDVTRGMDITVHDHLIIGAHGYTSLKAEGLIG